jgi:microcystin-dependent protein
MSTPYIGEIRIFAFGSRGAPNGWQLCDGSLLPISQNNALFALIGTTYGGDGQTTFAVPDMRGRIPIHQGTGPGLSNYVIGQKSGTETVTVLATQMPAHTHTLALTTSAATVDAPSGTVVPGAISGDTLYTNSTAGLTRVAMSASSTSQSGGSQPHNNLMPTVTVSYCMATQGIFPSQS